MASIISTTNLTKIYEQLRAVDNVSLSIQKGKIFGLIGLNGAGKTTLIRMLLGMIKPTVGKCYIQRQEVSAGNVSIWNNVGYIVETPHSYPELTARENLEIIQRLRRLEDDRCIDWVLEKLGLRRYASKKVRHLSLGNSQRLGIAKSIIHRPDVLILDEPMNGLDPAGIVEIRQLLVELVNKEGVTVLISSHQLDEIARIATDIAIIHDGKLVKRIVGNKLEQNLCQVLTLSGDNIDAIKCTLSKLGYQVKLKDGKSFDRKSILQIKSQEAIEHPEKIATQLVNAGHPPSLLKVETESLEDYFIRILKEVGGSQK